MGAPFVSLDFETTGLFDRAKPIDDPVQPHIMQIGAVLYGPDGKIKTRVDGLLVKPEDDWVIAKKATEIHGLTVMNGKRYGVSQIFGLGLIVEMCKKVDTVVGFNVEYDREVAVSCLLRLGKNPAILRRPRLEWIDVMKIATNICKLPGILDNGSYKWPTLGEAVKTILGEDRTDNHDAGEDALDAARLFLALREKGMIEGHSP